MKIKLNLTELNKQTKDIQKKEMKMVKAGKSECSCSVECEGIILPMADMIVELDFTDDGNRCPCGSPWVIFGIFI